MEISDSKINFNIHFDIYGNLYFSNNNGIYQIEIDKDNNIYSEQYKSTDIKLAKVNYGMIMTKISNKEDTFNQEIYNYNDYDDMIMETLNSKYEDNGFFGNEMYEFTDPKFYFLKSINKIPIQIVEYSDIYTLSLYETLIYDNNILVFKSKLDGEPPMYRIHIHTNGKIFFEQNGYEPQEYKLKYENLFIFNKI